MISSLIYLLFLQKVKLLLEKHNDDSNRRKKLGELLDKFIQTNKSFYQMSSSGKERIEGQTTLESLLQTEGITKDLAEDLRLKAQQITNGQCVVVVAGMFILLSSFYVVFCFFCFLIFLLLLVFLILCCRLKQT